MAGLGMRNQAFITPITTNPARRRKPALCHTRRHKFFCAASSNDWYKVLDVAPDANSTTIKRAYRRAALKNHPDVSKAPDAQERFLLVQEAYSVLSDPSKRAEYDRQVRMGQYSGGSTWPGSSGGSGFDPEEYIRNWREKNPMPSDLNDSFGSIFSDIFSGVASAVNSSSSSSKRPGIMDDFVEFLEKQVDGFGVDSSGFAKKGDDDGLTDVLRSSDVDVLRAEIEDAKFVLEQLEARREKLNKDAMDLQRRADEWGVRADRAERSRDYITRDSARDRKTDLTTEAKRLELRLEKTQSHIDSQKRRLAQIEERLETVLKEQSKPKDAKSSSVKTVENTKKASKTTIDDELERMKRELGL